MSSLQWLHDRFLLTMPDRGRWLLRTFAVVSMSSWCRIPSAEDSLPLGWNLSAPRPMVRSPMLGERPRPICHAVAGRGTACSRPIVDQDAGIECCSRCGGAGEGVEPELATAACHCQATYLRSRRTDVSVLRRWRLLVIQHAESASIRPDAGSRRSLESSGRVPPR